MFLRLLAAALIVAAPLSAKAAGVTYGGDGADGWVTGETLTAASLNASSTPNQIYYPADYVTGSDTGGVQEAIDACEGASPPGGTVQLPAGEVEIDATTVGLTGECLHLAGVLVSAVPKGLCTLAGHGSGAPISVLSGGNNGPSIIECRNMGQGVTTGGRFAGIRVDGHGQELRGFNLVAHSDTPAMTDANPAIFLDGAQDSKITDVTLRQGGGLGLGIGLELLDAQKSTVTRLHAAEFNYGVYLRGGGTGTNNATTFMAPHIRSAASAGIYAEGGAANNDQGCTNLSVHGGNIEGNEVGVEFASDSRCYMTLHGTRFENSGTGRGNIEINASRARWVGYGLVLGGAATYAAERTVDHFGGDWPGPDKCYDCWFNAGTNYTQGELVALDPSKFDGTMTGTTEVTSATNSFEEVWFTIEGASTSDTPTFPPGFDMDLSDGYLWCNARAGTITGTFTLDVQECAGVNSSCVSTGLTVSPAVINTPVSDMSATDTEILEGAFVRIAVTAAGASTPDATDCVLRYHKR